MTVELAAWSDGDLVLLEAANTPAMTAHLGGPESATKVLARHRRYLLLGEISFEYPPGTPLRCHDWAVTL